MPHKRVSKQLNKRLDHKQDRAAVRQVLDGGYARQPRHSSWSSPVEPVPVPDDAPSTGARKRKGCPKNKGGDHAPRLKRVVSHMGLADTPTRFYYITVCDFCGKQRLNHSDKGWSAQRRHSDPSVPYRYAIYTTDGAYVQGYFGAATAEQDCWIKNMQAEDLDIDVRYVVRSLA
jgi:hypothetical protein